MPPEPDLRDAHSDSADTDALAEHVARIVRERIVRGELGPGDRIVERSLSAELDVSRTPVREALKVLRADGLVEISRNRGAQVTAYPAREARDLFEVIGAIEAVAAGRVAASLDDVGLERFESLHADMLRHFTSDDVQRYFDANSAIHDAIVEASDNPILIASHRRLVIRARRGRYLAIMDDARWRQAVGEHEQLMDAFRSSSARRARAVWSRHLRHTGETVARLLES